MIEAAVFDFIGTLSPRGDELYPGAREILENLKKRGVKIAVATRSNDERGRRRAIESLGLGRYCEKIAIYSGGEIKDIGSVCEELGVSPQNTLVVGDSLRRGNEMAEGNRVGATTVLVFSGGSGGGFAGRAGEPDYTIDKIENLAELVDQIGT